MAVKTGNVKRKLYNIYVTYIFYSEGPIGRMRERQERINIT